MKRRDVLALCGTAIAGVAGCLSNSGDTGTTPTDDTTTQTDPSPTADPTTSSDPTTDPEPTPTEDPASTVPREGSALSVDRYALQPGVVVLTTPDSTSIEDQGQYLFLWIEVVAGDAPARKDFAFQYAGSTYDPIRDVRELYPKFTDRDPYVAKRGKGWVAFELPETGDAADAKLTWENGEWRPEESTKRRLSKRAPELSVSPSLPESMPVDEDPTIPVTVKNEGDRPTRFVATLNREGGGVAHAPVGHAAMFVAPGEERTWEATDYLPHSVPEDQVGDGDPDLTYDLDWVGGDATRKVRYTD